MRPIVRRIVAVNCGFEHRDWQSRAVLLENFFDRILQNKTLDAENIKVGIERTDARMDMKLAAEMMHNAVKQRGYGIMPEILQMMDKNTTGVGRQEKLIARMQLIDTFASLAMTKFFDGKNIKYCQLDSTEITDRMDAEVASGANMEQKLDEYEKPRIDAMVENASSIITPKTLLFVSLVGASHIPWLDAKFRSHFENGGVQVASFNRFLLSDQLASEVGVGYSEMMKIMYGGFEEATYRRMENLKDPSEINAVMESMRKTTTVKTVMTQDAKLKCADKAVDDLVAEVERSLLPSTSPEPLNAKSQANPRNDQNGKT